MQYDDENIGLSENEWQSMAQEYEDAKIEKINLSEELITKIYMLYNDLEMSLPKLNSLFELKLAMRNLFSQVNINMNKKSVFFSTPLSVLNYNSFEILNALFKVYQNEKENLQRNKISNLINAIILVGLEINKRKNNKW